MRDNVKKLLDLPVSRYILVGGLSYVIEISCIYLLVMSGVDRILAVAIGFWIGFFLAFSMQKIIAFKNKTSEAKQVVKQSVLYAVLVLFNYGFTLVLVALLSPLISIYISRTIALGITTCWNFIIYKKIIFS